MTEENTKVQQPADLSQQSFQISGSVLGQIINNLLKLPMKDVYELVFYLDQVVKPVVENTKKSDKE